LHTWGSTKHALRNASAGPAVIQLTTTVNIYIFFRELGKPFDPGKPPAPPTPEDMQRLRTLAAKHNYWMASPQENAAIGTAWFPGVTVCLPTGYPFAH
jgi:hypothetical protein